MDLLELWIWMDLWIYGGIRYLIHLQVKNIVSFTTGLDILQE